jgi:hypothetical protein
MKKTIIAAVLLLSFTATYAQFELGVKAGYTSSLSLSNLGSVADGSYSLSSVQGEMWNNFQAGIFARAFISKKVYIQPELLYAIGKKNYQVTLQNASTIKPDNFATISTVDVPILVGYKLLDLKIASLRVFGGPKIRLDAGSQLSFENTTGGTVDPNVLAAEVKKSQLGLEAGVGVDLFKFSLDARYNLIGDMYKTKLNNISSDKLGSTFVISLGWRLL